MAIGVLPTGTSDPYGLRRAASGVIALLQDDYTAPNLRTLFEVAWKTYAEQNVALAQDREAAFDNFNKLINQRLENALDELGIRYDVIAAVIGTEYANLASVFNVAKVLESRRQSTVVAEALAAVTRVGNILRFAAKEGIYPVGEPDPSLFADPTESKLWEAFSIARPKFDSSHAEGDVSAGLTLLAELRIPIDNFFNSVMIMDDDAAIRDNRLSLLTLIRSRYLRIADLEQLQS